VLNNKDDECFGSKENCECFPRDKSGKPVANTWYKLPTHVSISGWLKKYARCELISSTDYVYKDRTEVICNGCNIDMKPNNCWLVEYSDDNKEWEIYDVYCFDCIDLYFSEAEKINEGM